MGAGCAGRWKLVTSQTEAAVRLAPDLPAAHVALARALWEESRAPFAATRQALEALLAIPRHTEASLWFGGSLLYVLALALVAGGLACIALAAFFAAPHATHDLGDALSGSMPAFARAALLGSNSPVLSAAPAQLGEKGPYEGAEHLAGELRIVGAAVAERVRKCEHPLPDRNLGQNAVGEMGGGIGHAAAAA